ncbi:MAG: 50S ribosomal protein L4 [Candidatus Njordarchaeia archaeon]
MKTYLFDLEGKPVKEIDLPSIFESEIRPDLINRAVLAIRSLRYQPKGKSPAGDKKHVVESHGKGYDASRTSRTGGGFGTARFVALAVGGRRVRAPTSKKRVIEKINKKEKLRALISALAATADAILVQMRGHKVSRVKSVPIVVSGDFEKIEKTREVRRILESLGVLEDVEKAEASRRVRAGKGKRRGRKYKRRKSLLIVVSGENEEIIKSARNIEGVDVVPVDNLSVEHLAPGGHPGRLLVITEKALNMLNERIIELAKKHKLIVGGV